MNTSISKTPVGMPKKSVPHLGSSERQRGSLSLSNSMDGLSVTQSPRHRLSAGSSHPVTPSVQRKRWREESSEEKDELWEACGTPPTVPRQRETMKTSREVHTPVRKLRLSGSVEQTPPSQLLSQLMHGEEPSEGEWARLSGALAHHDRSLGDLLRHTATTASREVTLKSGYDLPSPSTPLWDVESVTYPNQSTPGHSQIVELITESQTSEAQHTNVRDAQLCDGASATQLGLELDSVNTSSGSLNRSLHFSIQEDQESFYRKTREFFAFIDSRPLLCVSPGSPFNKRGTPSATKFEAIISNVKKAIRTSSGSRNRVQN